MRPRPSEEAKAEAASGVLNPVGALRSSEGRALLDDAVATLSAHNAEQAATDRSLAGAKERQQDNEHTLGVMLRGGRLLELNGSILE